MKVRLWTTPRPRAPAFLPPLARPTPTAEPVSGTDSKNIYKVSKPRCCCCRVGGASRVGTRAEEREERLSCSQSLGVFIEGAGWG